MSEPGRQGGAAETAGIAVLGGSFDPPHTTHRRLAESALLRLPVAEVRVIPAGDHPHKQDQGMTAARHRLAMCRLAFGDRPGIVVDDRELRRAGPSFTVDTLAELAAERPRRPLFFLIGSDNLPLLPTWHDHHRLLRLATVVTWPRAGHPVTPEVLEHRDLTAAERTALLRHVLQVPPDDVAATSLRERLRRGERELPELEPAVRRYCEDHALYRA